MITSYFKHSPKGGAGRGLTLLFILPFLASTFTAQAQNSYMNERLINNSSDVIGTARYVGMGGAMGALGADMSVISWNPAGIGLFRKNDIALTFGGLWGKSKISEENRGKGTVDQAGFVYNMKIDSKTCPYVNFSFNYQKKINFNHNFYADNPNLGGLSQMDIWAQLTEFYDAQADPFNPVELALANNSTNIFFNTDANQNLFNPYRSYSNLYTHHSEGSLQGFDFNLSTNINNRAFLGLTVGVDNMRYRGWNDYFEIGDGNFGLYNYDIYVSGTGVNVKLGTIIRPIESSSFRFGFTIETPTWYRLRNSSLFYFYDDAGMRTNDGLSDLKFNVRSPWKVRTSIGSTIGSTFAWDIDYEYAAYGCTSMGYPTDEFVDGSTSGNYNDVTMNQLTRNNLRGTHTLRAGIEVNATKNLAFRLGYNLSTSAYKKNISYDQYYLSGYAMDYSTSTSYMRMRNTNILTLGMGYRTKNFYVDLAYKIRNQKADFYAFDTGFANSLTGDPVFLSNNTTLINRTIAPVGVDLTRQTLTCTLGFKF